MRILVFSSGCGLFKPVSGGRSRFYNLVKQLMNYGHQIWVLQPQLYRTHKDSVITNVYYFRTNFGYRTFTALTDFNPFFIVQLLKVFKVSKPDLIQASSPFGIISAKIIVRFISPRTKVVYDAHNVESAIYSLGASNRLVRSLLSVYILWQESLAVRLADHILAVSDIDKKRFMNKFQIKKTKITVIPSGVEITKPVDVIKWKKDVTKEQFTIVFHGSYFHRPNREAVELIRMYIAPKIREKSANVVFVLFGYGMPRFQVKNIVSYGFVPNLYECLSKADLAIVPIKHGSGTRLKVLDYMSMGLPIVTTKKGIEGIEAVNGEHVIIVDDVNESFIEAIVQLIRSETLRERLGINAKRLVERKYCWNIIGAQLCYLYEQICRYVR